MASPPVHVGISGWSYARWHGDYYPNDLPRRDELGYVASRLATVEVNASFYRLQRPTTYERWYDTTPDGFRFAVKGSRFLTHQRRLREPEQPLATFMASGVLALREKLGPFLWQLPAEGAPTPERLDAFCAMLPRSYGARLPLTHAVEVRSAQAIDEVTEILRSHRIALVVSDGAGAWPLFERATADFAYVRLHGHTQLYHGGYSDHRLRRWAERIRGWDVETWVYFDNDADGRAPYDAERLARRLR
ncbi:DUF72 domain-containing protein [Mumia sp. ZJ430]|uniref:DUF72 domain-containing protein n=1 Tax=Mumia sp. ZJ430 TaxID=2708083 RepID=UPI0014201827|nr:DUF72 domain-containing protein [Mumia sp. ZJ430]